jgi:hypothetical protein
LSRRLKLLPLLAFTAATFAATAALADNDAGTTHNCFRARDWAGWKAPAPNVLLVHVGANAIWRLDLQQGSDQLKYTDVRITNRDMKSAWLCVPSDFNLLLSDRFGIVREPLIVTSVRQLTPEEIAAIPPQDRP